MNTENILSKFSQASVLSTFIMPAPICTVTIYDQYTNLFIVLLFLDIQLHAF